MEHLTEPPPEAWASQGKNRETLYASVVGVHAAEDYERCYRRETLEHPQASGAFALRVNIGPSGEVLEVFTDDLRGDLSAAMLACCHAALRVRRFFPPAAGTATISFQASFRK